MEKQMRWLETVYALAKEDTWFQECRKQVESAEPAFIRLMNRLEPSEREALDRYVSACEELRFSLVPIAYEVGRRL